MHKLKKSWFLPALALGAITFVLGKSSCSESQHAAAVRLKNALISKDYHGLFSFVEPNEIEALRLSENSFKALLQQEFFNEWDFSKGNWNFEINKYQNGTYLLCESISTPDSRSSTTLNVVGEPGKFRCPGFIHFLILSTAMKRYGMDKSMPGGLGRMNAMVKFLESDLSKLETIGIVAEYDPVSKGVDPLKEVARRLSTRITEWKSKSNKT